MDKAASFGLRTARRSTSTLDRQEEVAVRLALPVLTVAALLAAGHIYAAEPRATGVYTNLSYNREGDDLLGVEILIIPAKGVGTSYTAFVEIAEGGAPFAAVVPLTVRGTTIEFRVPTFPDMPGLRFTGTLTAAGITGQWFDGIKPVGPFGSGDRERLKRGKSYWQ